MIPELEQLSKIVEVFQGMDCSAQERALKYLVSLFEERVKEETKEEKGKK